MNPGAIIEKNDACALAYFELQTVECHQFSNKSAKKKKPIIMNILTFVSSP